MSDETYEGWSNRETWAVNLHLNQDEGLYNQLQDLVSRAADTGELSALLKEWVENLLSEDWWRDELGSSMPRDIRTMRDDIGSVWRVDWYELADVNQEG